MRLIVILDDTVDRPERVADMVHARLETESFWKVRTVLLDGDRGAAEAVQEACYHLFPHDEDNHINAALQHLQRFGRPQGDVSIQHSGIKDRPGKTRSVRTVRGGLPTLGKRRK